MADEFNEKIIAAAAEREIWYDTVELPKVHENYRLHLSCIKILFDNLSRRGLVTPDPYKNEDKVKEIILPESTPFEDNKRASVLGMRLSAYETMIDYVCNYIRFSVESLSIETIRKLFELNKTFIWSNLSQNSSKPNTRGMAFAVNEYRKTAQQVSIGLLKDCLIKTSSSIEQINDALHKLFDFQRERYKVEIRRTIFEGAQFDKDRAYSSPGAMMTEIKRLFPSCMKGRKFINEFVGELVGEEFSPERDTIRQNLYDRLKIREAKEEKSAEPKVNVHEILMDAVRLVGSTNDQYNVVLQKICANHEILESERNTFRDKLVGLFRSVFGLKDPPVDYEVLITDKRTDTKKREIIHYNEFVSNLAKKIEVYSTFADPSGGGYAKIKQQKDPAILDYLNKQIVENNHLFAQIVALDEFFKKTAKPADRQKIKGMGMELTTIRNIIVKANQQRAEYLAYTKNQEQMKQLGVE